MSLNPWDPRAEQQALSLVAQERPVCKACLRPLRLYSATSGEDVKQGVVRVEGRCGRKNHKMYTYCIPVAELNEEWQEIGTKSC